MKVSVVIPTYNRLNYLGKCLKSLSKQSVGSKSFEVIVVDDGSTDGTAHYLKKINRKNFTFLRQSNKGPAAARNLGVRHAKGNIIAFIDDDCVARRDWIQNIITNFEKYKDADSVACHTIPIYKKYFKNLEKFEKRNLIKNFKVIRFSGLEPDHRASTDNCALKREIFMRLKGFNIAFKYAGEDPDFWYRLLKSGYNIYHVDNIIVYHYQRMSIKKMIKRSYLFGFADTINYKDHFRKHLYIDLRSVLNFKFFSDFPITIAIAGNMFVKLITLCLLILLIYPLLAILMLIIIFIIMWIKSRSLVTVFEFYFREIIVQFPMLVGKIIGSIKNRIIYI